ncbi:3-[(3aS,4S,7aS)-7a-methyl-1,5-dioxo-octahydro-1H-inden-4-yl]propanoyl:CoA ligase [Ixodes scapularis]
MLSRLRARWSGVTHRPRQPSENNSDSDAPSPEDDSRPVPYVLEGTIHHRAAPGDPPDGRPSVMIPDMISTCLQAVWNNTIAVSGDREYKGSDVLQMINMYANRFVAHGLHPGQRVWAKLHNTLQNWAASMGVIFAGGVLFLSSNSLIGGASINLLVESGARYILTDEGNKPLLQQWIADDARTAPPRNLFTYLAASLEDDSSSSGDEKRDFDVYSPRSNSCIGFVLYTPGYTGPPKGVEFSHRAYVTAFRICRALEHVSAEDVFLAWTPLANNFGFSLNVFPMLLGVFTVFKEPTMTHIAFTAAMSKNNVTTTFNFPTRIRNLVRSAGAPFSFPCFKKLAIGGESTADITEILQAFNSPIISLRYYGLAECFGLVIVSRLGREGYCDDGVPAPGCRVKIMPPQDDSEPNCEGSSTEASISDAYGSITGAFKRTAEVNGRIGESYETIEDSLVGIDFGILPKIKGHVNETKRTIREGLKEPSQVHSHGSGQSSSQGTIQSNDNGIEELVKESPKKDKKKSLKEHACPYVAKIGFLHIYRETLGFITDDTGTVSTSLSEYQSELSKPGKQKRDEFWFRTGDEGQYTTTGCITIHGRLLRPN